MIALLRTIRDAVSNLDVTDPWGAAVRDADGVEP